MCENTSTAGGDGAGAGMEEDEMQQAIHTPADMARFWGHPEVAALRDVVRQTNPRDKKAYKAALNAVRDKVAELKG